METRHGTEISEAQSEYRECEAHLAEGDDERQRRQEGRSDDLPDGVPSKATLTIKEINDNRYYWQWRDGDQVKSKYKGPVDSTE